jgi:hypothetical protein
MDELVGWLVGDLGVDRASRRKGGGDQFRLPVMEGSPDKVRPLLARLGRAEALLRLAASENAGGFGMSEVIGAGMRVKAAGPSMGQIQRVSRKVMAHNVMAHKVMAQILAYSREQVGAETVDKTVVVFPGLSQFT